MAAPIRVVFLGSDSWSVPSLIAIHEDPRLELEVAITREPHRGRRGSAAEPTPVGATARELGLPLLETPTVVSGEGLSRLRAARPDVLAVVAYGELLTPEVLTIAPLGAVNLHFSLLPRWRGAAPVRYAIMAGDRVTGVTTMLIDEGLDTGPVIDAREEPIRPDDDAGSLGARLAAIGAEVLVGSLEGLANGRMAPRSQEGTATSAPKIAPREKVLDWTQPAADLGLRIRGLGPEPGATTVFRGEPLKVLRAEVEAADGEPGTIVVVDREGFVVAAGAGAVRPIEVAPAGRRRMAAAAFARGARPRLGERLG